MGRRLSVLPGGLAEAGGRPDLQPVAGRFEVAQDAVWFIPRFPFRDGLGYALLVHAVDRDVNAPGVFRIERPAATTAPTTTVGAIYPSAAEVPVNLLKIYVHFSAPMSEGYARRAVSVRRADNGEPLEGVFLAMDPELWDPERRRLTLLLDPGRIKRGLAPNEEASYPLIEGVPMIVTVDRDFRDAAGTPLRDGAERRYGVGRPLRALVDPHLWRSRVPAAGSADALVVEFDRPLDSALLEHCLWVESPDGLRLRGRTTVGEEERSWRFEPAAPWRRGEHTIVVDARLEDLAGNSPARVFDRDLMRAEDAAATGPVVRAAFAVR